MATNVDFNAMSVEDLKEKLRALKAKTSGSKAELVKRLIQLDPSGEKTSAVLSEDMQEEHEQRIGGGDRTDPWDESVSEVAVMRRQLEIGRREQELVMRELALAKREIELLRDMQRFGVAGRDEVEETGQRATASARTVQEPERNVNVSEASTRLNITTIAELLSAYDGRSDTYETWERQVIFLRNAYKLSDDLAKVMVGSRLKGKALEWLHSRPDYIAMPVSDLLGKLREMFHHQPSKISMRKQFEQRVWKREETFSAYLHDKVIMANRIPIDDKEIIEYVIEGIPDPALRDQA